ncbi:MAG: hypothetical protein NZ899_07045 [Thermoguttaceae bacterium]|nr:hypothetical protein [Thermoguttaceae bacterium]MDW8079692.1 hypothetical protein [Thermoguttaceae bacterium]
MLRIWEVAIGWAFRVAARGHFWFGLAGLALIAWIVVTVVKLSEDELERTAGWWGLALALGAMLAGLLPGAVLGGSPWWVIWLSGMFFRMFAPLVAIALILMERAGQGAEAIAIYTAAFYCAIFWVGLIPEWRRSQRAGKESIHGK